MSEKEIFDKLINVFSIVINRNVDAEKINMDSKIVEDLGVNSIGLVYLAVALEEEFDVDMSNASLESFKTIRDVINYING
jgi:acyl carrier protein